MNTGNIDNEFDNTMQDVDNMDNNELFSLLYDKFDQCDTFIDEKNIILEDCLSSVNVFLDTLDAGLIDLRNKIKKS